MTEKDQIWQGWYRTANIDPGGAEAPSGGAASERKRNFDALTDALLAHAPALLHGEWKASLSDETCSKILNKLQKRASQTRYRERVRMLTKGLILANRSQKQGGLGSQIALPPPVNYQHRPLGPFSPDMFEATAHLGALDKALLNSLAHTSSLEPIERFAQLTLCGILHGALLSRADYRSLAQALKDHVHADRFQVWVDFVQSAPEEENEAADKSRRLLRRWIPDPLSQLLLILGVNSNIWQALKPLDITHLTTDKRCRLLRRSIRSFLCHFNPEGVQEFDTYFPTLERLRQAALTRTALKVSPFLVDYACGAGESYSLSREPWTRARRDKRGTSADVRNKTQVPLLQKTSVPARHSDEHPVSLIMGSQVALYMQLIHAIQPTKSGESLSRAKRIAAIKELLRNEAAGFFPLLLALAHWSIYKFNDMEDSEGTLRASSVYRYVTALGKSFAAHIPNLPIRALDADQYLELYEQILGKSKRKSSSRLLALRQMINFHEYLVNNYDAAPIDHADWEETSGAITAPNVNLVTPNEYHYTLNLLNDQQPSDTRDVQRLLTIFGYRCGLRRRECLTIRLCDAHLESQEPCLYIERTAYNALKSASARRRLPLGVLLTHGELAELRRWKELIQENTRVAGRNDATLLFPDPSKPNLPFPETALFPTIQRALQEATGDATVHFHTLRHSFANRTLLALLDIRAKSDLNLSGFSEKDAPAGILYPDELQRAVFGKARSSRAAIFGLATLLGHADTKTSLRHYVHLLDLLLGYELRNCGPNFTQEITRKLLGLSLGRANQLSKRSNAGTHITPRCALSNYLASPRHRSDYPLCTKPHRRKGIRHRALDQEAIRPITPGDIWAAVRRVGPANQDINQRAPQSAVALREAAWARTAIGIANLRTRQKKPRHLLTPVTPHLKADREDLNTTWKNLQNLSGKSRALAQRAVSIFLSATTVLNSEVRFHSRVKLTSGVWGLRGGGASC